MIMDIIEIILLIVGGVVFTLSFIIPEKKSADIDTKGLAEDEVRAIVSREIASVESRIENLMDKTERSLEKLSNEKIMAVEEYSDTVLSQIRKNHEEAVFLYDMLNNKQTSLKSGLAELTRSVKEAREAAGVLEKLGSKGEAVKDKTGENTILSPGRDAQKDSEKKASGELRAAGERKAAAGAEEEKSAPQGILSGRQAGEDMGNNNERILGLYRQGKSAAAIAKELGLGVGEVRLVIDLFRE